MIKEADELSVVKQCELLKINRSGYYYDGKTEYTEQENRVHKKITQISEECPFYGVRRIYEELKGTEEEVGRDRVGKYMKMLGIKAIYPSKRTTIPNKEHKKYKYLLKEMDIDKANKVWCADITYIKLEKGFCYLITIMDWYSRKILSYRISNTLEEEFCLEALEEAIERYGAPDVFNTDQGSQFTADDWIEILDKNDISISMDGKGRWVDNVLIERFFRTIKYEDIFLRKYENLKDLKLGIRKYLKFYNQKRKHSSLGYQTPDEVYQSFFDSIVA